MSRKVIKFLTEVWKILTWSPLLLTSLLFKTGMIYLSIRFFGWNAAFIIVGQIILNLIQISLISFCKAPKVQLHHQDKYMPPGTETTKGNHEGYVTLDSIYRGWL